jgi:hypothetical protein
VGVGLLDPIAEDVAQASGLDDFRGHRRRSSRSCGRGAGRGRSARVWPVPAGAVGSCGPTARGELAQFPS